MAFITSSGVASGTGLNSPRGPLLSIRNVAKSFGKNVVLRNISLEIAEGEFLTILGESGSGKTTLLRIIAGFESASAGDLWMGEERLDPLPGEHFRQPLRPAGKLDLAERGKVLMQHFLEQEEQGGPCDVLNGGLNVLLGRR